MVRRLLAALGAALIVIIGLSAPTADAARVAGAGEVYGWSWDHPVTVYDGTPSEGRYWKISEAVSEFDKITPLSITMTNDPTTADVAIYEVEQPCGPAGCGAGYAFTEQEDLTIVGGHPAVGEQCVIHLQTFVGTGYYAAEMVALHEFGHCLGLAHVYAPNAKNGTPVSVMVTPMDAGNYITRPTRYDGGNLARLYG